MPPFRIAASMFARVVPEGSAAPLVEGLSSAVVGSERVVDGRSASTLPEGGDNDDERSASVDGCIVQDDAEDVSVSTPPFCTMF